MALTVTIANYSDRVLKAERRARAKWLRRSAAYVWRTARNSIKSRQTGQWHTYTDAHGVLRTVKRFVHSSAGVPPYDHYGWKRTFAFAIDGESAVIGPTSGRLKTIAQLHEYGGEGKVRWLEWAGYRQRRTYSRIVHFPARPTMQPALAASQSRITAWLKDMI